MHHCSEATPAPTPGVSLAQGASICPWCAHREGKRKGTEDKPKPLEGSKTNGKKKKAGEEKWKPGDQIGLAACFKSIVRHNAKIKKTLQRRLRSGINHHPMAWLCSIFALQTPRRGQENPSASLHKLANRMPCSGKKRKWMTLICCQPIFFAEISGRRDR